MELHALHAEHVKSTAESKAKTITAERGQGRPSTEAEAA